jgi:hypothetical protein
MADETEIGSAGTDDGRGHTRGSSGEQSPLQTRAALIQNWSWESVIGYNRGACARGGAQHGLSRETEEACRCEWEEKRRQVISLAELIEFLRHCHRRAPFLFFNGNTFADIARQISAALFADLAPGRRREVMSAVAHYIAGVLPWDAMAGIVESLSETADWKPGDRVQTLRSSTHGVIVRLLEDGRVVWRPDGTESELTGLPESLVREAKGRSA